MKIFYLSSIFLTVLFSSCWTTSKFVERAQYDTSKVPPGFNPGKQTLLVCEIYRLFNLHEVNKTQTENLNKLLQKYYPYKYEIVSREDIISKNSKYSDTTKYKFGLLYYLTNVLNSTAQELNTINGVNGANYSNRNNKIPYDSKAVYIDFGFYDRSASKVYPSTGNWAQKMEYGIAAFVELLEKARTQKR